MSRVRYLAVAPPLVLGSVALIVAPPALAGSLLVAGVLSAELLASLRRHPTPTRVGIANLLTLLRGLLIGALVLYVIGGPLGLPAVGAVLLYGTASALDAVDGFVARHRAETTAVGADLDQAVDSLGFVLAPLAAIALGALPVYYLALSAARYVYLAAAALAGAAPAGGAADAVHHRRAGPTRARVGHPHTGPADAGAVTVHFRAGLPRRRRAPAEALDTS
jgi:phosphatidylglycerophosphate synthase